MTNEKELRQKLEVMLPRNKAGNDMLRAIISMAKQKGRKEIEDKFVLTEEDCHILEDLFKLEALYIYKILIEKQGQEKHYTISFTRQ